MIRVGDKVKIISNGRINPVPINSIGVVCDYSHDFGTYCVNVIEYGYFWFMKKEFELVK